MSLIQRAVWLALAVLIVVACGVQAASVDSEAARRAVAADSSADSIVDHVLSQPGSFEGKMTAYIDSVISRSDIDGIEKHRRLSSVFDELKLRVEQRREIRSGAIALGMTVFGLGSVYVGAEARGGGSFEPLFSIISGITELASGLMGGALGGWTVAALYNRYFAVAKQIDLERVEQFRKSCTESLLAAKNT